MNRFLILEINNSQQRAGFHPLTEVQQSLILIASASFCTRLKFLFRFYLRCSTFVHSSLRLYLSRLPNSLLPYIGYFCNGFCTYFKPPTLISAARMFSCFSETVVIMRTAWIANKYPMMTLEAVYLDFLTLSILENTETR